MQSRLVATSYRPSWGTLTVLVGLTAGFVAYCYSKINHKSDMFHLRKPNYAEWKEIIAQTKIHGKGLLVDIDNFNENLSTLVQVVSDANNKNRHKKTIRLATKSLRVPRLIEHALARGGEIMKGLMCYSAREAEFLWQQKITNDFLIAYPTVDPLDLKILHTMHLEGATVRLVLDSYEQMKLVSQAMSNVRNPFPIVLELDTSIRLWQGFKHIGARRSPLYTLDDLSFLLDLSKEMPCIKVVGVMAYESAVAALADNKPNINFFMNYRNYFLRKASVIYTEKIRREVPKIFAEKNMRLEIFNGGGTGSINFTAQEDSGLTELTFGSGVLNPHLFDDKYSNLKSLNLKPAIFFVRSIQRKSDKGKYVTCSGGIDIASGPVGPDKMPIVVSPPGLVPTSEEGCGEVQTPLRVTDKNLVLNVGDPIVFGPAKSGEAAESYNTVTCFWRENSSQPKSPSKQDYATNTILTYRGWGKNF